MKKSLKVMFCLGTFALATAFGASNLKVTSPLWAGDTQLKPGEYKIEMRGDKVAFKNGKDVIEVPATVETGSTKFSDTITESTDSKLTAIRLGGTNSKIVFKSGATTTAAGGGK